MIRPVTTVAFAALLGTAGACAPILAGAPPPGASVDAASVGAPARPAGEVELYGKPLRGLSAAPLAEVAAGRHLERALRVTGVVRSAGAGGVTISEGEASLLVLPDGFSVPEDVAGARMVVEGRAKKGDSGIRFVASGLEVRR